MDASPVRVVSATKITYSCIFAASKYFSCPTNDLRANLKAISSVHSVLTTLLGLTALLDVWSVDGISERSDKTIANQHLLDDSQNHLIVGKSSLGNAVTSFETGYLLYDNIALLLVTQSELKSSSLEAISHLVRNEPLLVIHHVGIAGGLGILQTYISKGQERGIWIIVALILMRASDPVLHWRWWKRKRTGKPDVRLDLLLAVVFAACRFGTVGWILKSYGDYHKLSPWTAFSKQRLVCQVGTGVLSALNAIWLASLIRTTIRRLSQR